MTPTPPSTTPSSGAHSPEEQFRVKRKRNRVPLSCYPCRTRKKCDRGHPCSNCMKREGVGASGCSYAAPSNRKKNQSQGATSPDDMQNRIDRLEGLVLALMHGGGNMDPSSAAAAAAAATTSSKTSGPRGTGVTPTTSASPSSIERHEQEDRYSDMKDDGDDDEDSDADNGLATSLGFLKVDPEKGKAIYIGQDHWHTILSGISEVKSYFNEHKKDLERGYEKVLQSKPAVSREGPTLLLGAPPASEVELRAELPSKSTVLVLCSRYFNSMDNAVNVVHAPTFRDLLAKHWQEPSKTPITWLGMLYSMLCLAMLSYHKVGDEPTHWKGRTLELAAEYRMRTVQCLVAADFTRPSEYTVETMLLYLFGEASSRWDADLGLWLISSVITRLAFRMGYHRDGAWFPTFSPFQAEMRRRTWALVRMSDVMFSLQVSLPTMIHDFDCDTQLPNNIFDEEFGPESKVLPQPRPQTTPTPMSYMIAKSRLSLELGNILQATTRVGKQVPYEEILRLDARLREVVAELPPHLKMQSLEDCHDPLTLIVARINVDVLIQKIFCLLHRKYLPRSRENPRYAHSRRTAIEASMDTLRHLEMMHRESQEGRLRSLRWYVKKLATREFLLPAMLIGLDLHYDKLAESAAVSGSVSGRHDSHTQNFWTPEQRLQMIKSLEVTREIWDGLKDTSMEAYKASNVIRIVLEKIHSPPPPAGSPPERYVPIRQWPEAAGYNLYGPTGGMTQDQSAAMTLGMLSGMTPTTAAMLDSVQSPSGSTYPQQAFPSLRGDLGEGPAAGIPGGIPMDLSMDMYGLAGSGNPGSPFSAFLNSSTTNAMDISVNFDWDVVESYAQNANFGPDSFQFVGGNAGEGGGGPAKATDSFGNVQVGDSGSQSR